MTPEEFCKRVTERSGLQCTHHRDQPYGYVYMIQKLNPNNGATYYCSFMGVPAGSTDEMFDMNYTRVVVPAMASIEEKIEADK